MSRVTEIIKKCSALLKIYKTLDYDKAAIY